MAARHWTAEQRAKQAAKIGQWQPWARSIGARTPETGLASSCNAYKGGHHAMLREMSVLLRGQRTRLKKLSRRFGVNYCAFIWQSITARSYFLPLNKYPLT